ncbi:MAG: putative membrane chloride channel (bestrophin family) [Arenicella sp.]|jgi:predicted membrane chloride channel (bestrophin family)
MKIIRSFLLIVNYKTFIIAVLSIVSTYLCHENGYMANFPLTLISVAIVFPIVFSINSAYTRREKALEYYASIKSSMVALFFGARDWVTVTPNPLPKAFAMQFRDNLEAIKGLLMNGDQKDIELDKKVYVEFDKLSKMIQQFRENGVAPPEISRANHYLHCIMESFENMRNIAYYRTPITLRAYSKVFIYSFPVLYGPYFAYAYEEYKTYLTLMMPVLYSFVLVSLANIQELLENPYDEWGEDDIQLDIDEISEILNG